MAHYILLLGSNIGNRIDNLSNARNLIDKKAGSVLKCSDIITTEPIGEGVHGLFSNQAITISSEMGPEDLLDTLESIEREMGRPKPLVTTSWRDENRVFENRIIDIDILFLDLNNHYFFKDRYLSDRIEIPHRAIKSRPFVEVLTKALISFC